MGKLYIPEMFEEEVTWAQASAHFHNQPGDLLDSLQDFDQFYKRTLIQICALEHDSYTWDCDFFEDWSWEICYFNCLFAGFSELFAPKQEVA